MSLYGNKGTEDIDQGESTSTYTGIDTQVNNRGTKRYIFWFGTTLTLFIFGTLLLLIDTGVALYCLNKYGFSTAVCEIDSSSFDDIDELRAIAESIEPILSVLMVISILIYTENPTFHSAKCCSCQNLPRFRYLCRQYWFTTYLCMLFISFGYHFTVFVLDVGHHWEGALRYITLPLGLTAWFVWMVMLNERGAMTTVVRDNLQTMSGLNNVQTDSLSGDPPGLSKFYKVLLIFAGSTNFIEFLIYTVYITGSFATIPATQKNRLLWYFDFLAMSLTTALRFSLASFFFQMLYIGEKKYKQMTDPWKEKCPDCNRHERLTDIT
ncbi:uncharacterized protein LOC144449490 [Glandiceps talaboti]